MHVHNKSVGNKQRGRGDRLERERRQRKCRERNKGKTKNQTNQCLSEPEESPSPSRLQTLSKPSPMPCFSDKNPPPRIRKSDWARFFIDQKALKNVVFKMHLETLEHPHQQQQEQQQDLTLLLSDEILVRILSKLPQNQYPCSLVCKRWFKLQGKLLRSIKLHEWTFLVSKRLVSRFPNLTDVDLVPACIRSVKNSGIILTHNLVTIHLGSSDFSGRFINKEQILSHELIDNGLKILAQGCPNLQKLVVIDVHRFENSISHSGLSWIANECSTLQELELHNCGDSSLRAISSCKNLQILRLIGFVDGFYDSVISDIGLTILAHGCKRLVKLELTGCEGSYDGISAIGKCCFMLEELTLGDHKMGEGWIAALSFCSNLKTLRLQGCKKIDSKPGPVEYLGSCPTLERLHLQQCHLRCKDSSNALFLVCGAVREIVFQDCWGLDNEIFSLASSCRRVKFLSLEGCSLLTTEGLEAVVLSWKDLQRLKVVSCKNIRDSEVTPALSSLFSVLKGLKWRPDSKSILASSLEGTGMGKKGGRFFKRV